MDLEPLLAKWQSFDWPVLEINGHDVAQIDKALDQAEATRGAPTLIVAHTVKGKGVSFMENTVLWHYRVAKGDEYEMALQELERD